MCVCVCLGARERESVCVCVCMGVCVYGFVCGPVAVAVAAVHHGVHHLELLLVNVAVVDDFALAHDPVELNIGSRMIVLPCVLPQEPTLILEP